MCQVLCPGGIPLELGQVEEALRLVQGEPAAEKALESLLCGVEVPLVSALLLGKRAGNHVIDTPEAFCDWLVEHHGVAIVPGTAFGAPTTVRLSFAASEEDIGKAMQRMAKAVGELR